jgi:formylglycine-generating enzyme required for sulfatase activity
VHVELRNLTPTAGAYRVVLALALPIAAAACSADSLPPIGEVVVIVDTDLPVPAGAARLRVDLYAEDGEWYESRVAALRNPSDWPASFGLVAPGGGERRVLVRLRVYPEGKDRDYRGERFAERAVYEPPVVAASMNELCAAPPQLPLGGTVTLRRGRGAFIGLLSEGGCATYAAANGSTAAAIDVVRPGSYRFGVLDTTPDGYQFTLQLRSDCLDESTALACDTGITPARQVTPAQLEVELEPGRYYLVTGGSALHESPADVVLGAAESAAWPPVYPPALPAPVPVAPQLAGPRFTPASEPQPFAAVDRLLLVRIQPDALLSTRVTLRGACLGTMAQLESSWPHQRPALDEASTCVSTAGERELVREAPLETGTDTGPSVQGTFRAPEPCDPGAPGRVCVPGGFFLLGSPETATGNEWDSVPERAAAVSRFMIDRYEVTVARYRAALAEGFNPGADRPVPNEGPMGDTVPDFDDHPELCTWSKEPQGREDLALNCLSWYGARALCRFAGGDLPTEAQWEYVATAAGREYETSWPWGNDPPACDCATSMLPCHRAVFGRSDLEGVGIAPECHDERDPTTFGPLWVSASEGAHGDETPALDGVNGVVGLAGGVREWVRDAFRPFDHPCWEAASVVDPECVEHEAPERVARGGDWVLTTLETFGTWRASIAAPTTSFHTGFRCVYPSASPP